LALVAEGDSGRITRAVSHLRERMDEPLKIENMARELGMSVSGFHQHFKSGTSTRSSFRGRSGSRRRAA
jgi:AraC-like DNA-binding protein